MTRKISYTAILALLLVFGLTEDGNAQDRRGTAGASYLLIPHTAQTVSLGTNVTSGLATINPVEGLMSNPAAMTNNTGTAALFSHMNYAADIGLNSFGVVQAFGNNQIGLNITAWDFGEILKRDEATPEGDGTVYEPSTIVAGLSYGRAFTDRISAGLTVKGLSETIEDMQAFGVAFDAGMTYVVGQSGLRFGVSLTNFGPQMRFFGNGLTREAQVNENPDSAQEPLNIPAEDFELPAALNFGAAYTRDIGGGADVTLLGGFQSHSYESENYLTALEIGFMDLIYLRGGYEFSSDADLSAWEGYNLGAGLDFSISDIGLSVDYAYRGMEFFDDTQVITAGVTF